MLNKVGDGARTALRSAARRIGATPRSFVLVSGSPRSGTSALEAWLGSQRGVASFFESRTLVAAHALLTQAERFRALHGRLDRVVAHTRRLALSLYADERLLAGRVLVDKEPLEPVAFPSGDYEDFMRHVDLLFPERRLLLLVREPVSTVWSMRNRRWGESLVEREQAEWSLETSIEVWRANARMALDRRSDPQTLVVRFEDLVDRPAEESKRIGNFIGLDVTAFEPRPTKEVAFDPGAREAILEATGPERPELGY